MRRLADQLGVGAGAVYWHVGQQRAAAPAHVRPRHRQAADAEARSLSAGVSSSKQAARDERDMMTRHPGNRTAHRSGDPVGPNSVRYIEWHLSILSSGGLSERVDSAGRGPHLPVHRRVRYEECLALAVTQATQKARVHDFVGRVTRVLRIAAGRPIPEPRRRWPCSSSPAGQTNASSSASTCCSTGSSRRASTKRVVAEF